ncbi:hypothetical protein M9H77_27969 [Catharanthus roseus]|uniref:Uncharacterized protein n=1 Tax=Catharanthus roseus TaxID=4058 RepID=A0ACC0AI60_CATRO|nr:hypothetical protein M9H77_27969 [Catharanthus roseus]
MDNVMVGFTEDADRIIESLTGGLPHLDIVAIVGMPGQGKTTLAKNLYHESRVRIHFQKYAWSCVSQTYKIKEILFDILNQVNPSTRGDDISSKSHEDLAEMLYRCLKGNNYFIVLDDIWEIGAWNELKPSFPDDENGSRIMFTSRIHQVALKAKPDCSLHELHQLQFEDSWKLLQLKLPYGDEFPLNLLNVGKQIVENCKGLPLAIVVVAGLLAKANENLNLWKQIADSLDSQVASEGCMEILELSYTHLPEHLKPCFLYLAAFKEDETILAKRLTRYWIVEGFTQKKETKSLEDVANEYLMDLIDRSLIFVAERSSRYGIKKCVVHDLIRELCLKKAKVENFMLVINNSDNYSFDTLQQWYRLSFHTDGWPSIEFESKSTTVATLIFSKHMEYPKTPLFFRWFQILRILDLDCVKINCKIDAITKLVHLRYLALRGRLFIPYSIVNLSRLEFFKLHDYGFYSIPNTIWNMKSLQHLCLGQSNVDEIDDLVDKSIQLDNLETFSSYHVCSKEELERQLRRMPNLRKLGIYLEFCIQLSNFLSKLESLNLWAPGVELSASEFDFPSLLKKLTINGATLSDNMILAIGKLPNLEVLKLAHVGLGEIWDVEDDEFLKLKYLELQGSDIEQWNVSTYSFPQIQQLFLKDCYNLTEIPFSFSNFLTLKVIEILGCSYEVADSVNEIVVEQGDLGNVGLQIRTEYLDEDRISYLRS